MQTLAMPPEFVPSNGEKSLVISLIMFGIKFFF
jgi:hypothetical protein